MARVGDEEEVKKNIFTYEQWVLSINMKTKIVQHVESDWMRDWKSVRVSKSDSERLRESDRVTEWESEFWG